MQQCFASSEVCVVAAVFLCHDLEVFSSPAYASSGFFFFFFPPPIYLQKSSNYKKQLQTKKKKATNNFFESGKLSSSLFVFLFLPDGTLLYVPRGTYIAPQSPFLPQSRHRTFARPLVHLRPIP